MLESSPLGRVSAFPEKYAPEVLVAVPRDWGRKGWWQPGTALPFAGFDEWTCWELSWCDGEGRPQMASGTLWVPATSPALCESKSLKLYLHSLNEHRFASADAFVACVCRDVGACVGAAVRLTLHDSTAAVGAFAEALTPMATSCVPSEGRAAGDVRLLRSVAGEVGDETLYTPVFRSVCPITRQPDWASVYVRYQGPRIDAAGLSAYLLSYRSHGALHEQCVEQIYVDVLQACQPRALSVLARFTRRGGIDINPYRSNAWPAAEQRRTWRQ